MLSKSGGKRGGGGRRLEGGGNRTGEFGQKRGKKMVNAIKSHY